MTQDTDAATSVYRYYDEHDVLIYVGITSRGIGRNIEHNKSKPWWKYVARQEVDHLSDRAAATRYEAELIRAHTPPFNVQHNPGHAEVRAAYEDLRARWSATVGTSGLDMARSLGKSLPVLLFGSLDGLVTLRTEPEHWPVAARLTKAGTVRVVCGSTVVGRVDGVEHRGMVSLVTAQIRAGYEDHSAFIDVKVLLSKGEPQFGIRRMRLIPQPREKQYVAGKRLIKPGGVLYGKYR